MGGRVKTLFGLHLLLMVYSCSGIFSKLASGYPFFSPEFIGLYAGMLAILGIYAVGWQQILKRLPLTTAFANKAVTVIWGIVWGCLFFAESLTLGKVIGAVLIVIGVILFSRADGELAAAGASHE